MSAEEGASALVTIREACARLAVSHDTLARIVERGELERVRVGVRAVRIPLRALNAFIERRTERLGR